LAARRDDDTSIHLDLPLQLTDNIAITQVYS